MSLRPLNLPDDFPALENVINSLFQDPDWGMEPADIDDLLGMLRFLRQLWSPIRAVRWLVRGLQDTLLGYVWVIDTRIVGMIMYDRKLGTHHWQVALLAVIPSFRQRGIASRLIDAAILDIYERGGVTVRLEIGGESTAGRDLFARMGFETYNGFYEYEYARLAPPPAEPLPEDYSVYPLGYYASQPRFELAQRIATPAQNRYEPPRLREFKRNRLWWGLRALSLAVQGVREHEVVVRTRLDGQVVARGGMAIRSRWGDISEIAIRVDDAHTEIVPYMMHRLVAAAQRASRRRRIEMICPTSQPAVIDYAEANGFEQLSAYYKMGMVLRPDAVAYPPNHAADLPALPSTDWTR